MQRCKEHMWKLYVFRYGYTYDLISSGGKKQEAEDSYIMRNFIICSLHQILLGRLDGRDKQKERDTCKTRELLK
jgi:hypothetical protein